MMSVNIPEPEGGPPKKKRRSKWDITGPDTGTAPNPPQAPPTATPTDPTGAAAAAAAKLNAMLAAQGKLIKSAAPPLLPPNPSVVPPSSNTLASVSRPAPRTSDSGTIASEIDINDLDIRGHLTKSPTLSELNRTTGAFVSVRGRYFRPGDRPQGPGDRPLHLHIQASSQDKVDAAVRRINEIITSSGHPGRVPRAPPPGSAPQMPVAPLFPGGGNLTGGMHYVQDKVFVGLEQVPEAFKLLDKLQGPGGAFLSHIATQTGAKIHLRGRGSGFIEPTSGKESFEALYIYISHSNSEGLGAARKLCENLIETVRQEHEGWRRSQQPLGFGGFAPHYGPPPPRHHGYRGPYHQQPPYGPPPPGYGAPPPGYQPQGHMLPHGPPRGYGAAPPPGPGGAPPHGYGGAPPPGPARAPPPGPEGLPPGVAPPHRYAEAPPPGPAGAPPPGYAGAPPPGPAGAPPPGYAGAPPPGPDGHPPAGPGGAPPYGYTEAPPPGPGEAPPPGPPSVPPYNYYPPPAHGGYYGPPGGFGGYGPPPANYQHLPPAPEQQPGSNPPPPPGPAPSQQPRPQSGPHWHPDAQFHDPPPKRRFTEQVEAPPTGKGISAAPHSEMQDPVATADVPTPPSSSEEPSPKQPQTANPDANSMRRFTEVSPTNTPETVTDTPPVPAPAHSLQQGSGPKWKPLTSSPGPAMPPPSKIPSKGTKNSLMPPPSLPGNKAGLTLASQEGNKPPASVAPETSRTPSKRQLVSLVAYGEDSDSDSDV